MQSVTRYHYRAFEVQEILREPYTGRRFPALEEAGIELMSETNSVTLHPSVTEAAICADPSMPLGVRRIYPR